MRNHPAMMPLSPNWDTTYTWYLLVAAAADDDDAAEMPLLLGLHGFLATFRGVLNSLAAGVPFPVLYRSTSF